MLGTERSHFSFRISKVKESTNKASKIKPKYSINFLPLVSQYTFLDKSIYWKAR